LIVPNANGSGGTHTLSDHVEIMGKNPTRFSGEFAAGGRRFGLRVRVPRIVVSIRSIVPSALMPLPPLPRFMVVDDNPDSRFLLVKTLLRKFPAAVVQECQHAETAISIAQTETIAAIVTHRTAEVAGVEVVRGLRAANPSVPIVMVSGIDRRMAAIAAGANAFLLYDEWLRIGTVVAELLGAPPDDTSTPPFSVDKTQDLSAEDALA
jgi:CheY-like chemotaxis protein